jgi:hypothetical protein
MVEQPHFAVYEFSDEECRHFIADGSFETLDDALDGIREEYSDYGAMVFKIVPVYPGDSQY